MNYKEKFQIWIDNVKDEELLNELKNMNDDQIKESFYDDISFGTGGLRGLMGAGSSKMNIITVAKVTTGFAMYLQKNNPGKDLRIAISSDPRNKSRLFINLIISILHSYNIKSYIFDDIKPTPMLSFLVRDFKCDGGIMITASHNPKEYNGYKVYNQHGGQLTLKQSDDLINIVNKIDYPFDIQIDDINDLYCANAYEVITKAFDLEYFNEISRILKNKEAKNLKIVFTPEHGTTYDIIPKAFKHFNFNNIILTQEQMTPDGNFTNAPCINPEEEEAYTLALKYAKENDADLVIANDPDGDRIGIFIKNKKNEFIPLSGNLTGSLLINYLIKRDNLNSGTIYKTIVTGELGKEVAKKHNINTVETLTGFKFIAQKIEDNKNNDFIFGYEESYGYLIDPCVRDKDGIQAALLIAEMVQYYKDIDKTLDEVLEELYKEYGYYHEVTHSITLTGLDGLEKINNIIEYYKNTQISNFKSYIVENKIDYNIKQDGLEQANVIKFFLKDLGWITFRPSGTEPKLKVYISIKSDSLENSKNISTEIYKEITNLINKI